MSHLPSIVQAIAKNLLNQQGNRNDNQDCQFNALKEQEMKRPKQGIQSQGPLSQDNRKLSTQKSNSNTIEQNKSYFIKIQIKRLKLIYPNFLSTDIESVATRIWNQMKEEQKQRLCKINQNQKQTQVSAPTLILPQNPSTPSQQDSPAQPQQQQSLASQNPQQIPVPVPVAAPNQNQTENTSQSQQQNESISTAMPVQCQQHKNNPNNDKFILLQCEGVAQHLIHQLRDGFQHKHIEKRGRQQGEDGKQVGDQEGEGQQERQGGQHGSDSVRIVLRQEGWNGQDKIVVHYKVITTNLQNQDTGQQTQKTKPSIQQ